jgi:hypothetical protein
MTPKSPQPNAALLHRAASDSYVVVPTGADKPMLAEERRLLTVDRETRNLLKIFSPVALKGLTWGTGFGTALAGLVAVVVTCVGLVTPVVPGLGIGIFLATVLVCAGIGLALQLRARRQLKDSAQLPQILENLDKVAKEISDLTPNQRRLSGENKTLKQIKLLQAQVAGSPKHLGKQVLAGFVDCVSQFIEVGGLAMAAMRPDKAVEQDKSLANTAAAAPASAKA